MVATDVPFSFNFRSNRKSNDTWRFLLPVSFPFPRTSFCQSQLQEREEKETCREHCNDSLRRVAISIRSTLNSSKPKLKQKTAISKRSSVVNIDFRARNRPNVKRETRGVYFNYLLFRVRLALHWLARRGAMQRPTANICAIALVSR